MATQNAWDTPRLTTNGQLVIGSTGTRPAVGTLTAPVAGIDITSGAGSITFSLADDLSAVEGIATTGMAARTAADTWTTRTIAASAGTGISVANGDGVAGAPTLSGIDASASVKGVASFDTYDFVVSTGNVIQREGVKTYFVGKWGNDLADGLTFSSAKLTIQAAVTAAGSDSCIYVYPGTYTETITHGASNVSVLGMGFRSNIIITQADANVINFNTRTAIIYQDCTIQCTAATTDKSTITGTTGSIALRQCSCRMVSAAALVAASQPRVATVAGTGVIEFRRGVIEYLHTGACGGTAIKSALIVENGGLLNILSVRLATITNSGTALASTFAVDGASSGNINISGTTINIADPDAAIVAGFGYLSGTGVDHEFMRNDIHVAAGAANTAYGIYAGATATTTRSMFNHIHVSDAGGSSYGFLVGVGATLISQFDDIVAVDGNTIAGTFTQVNSEADGYLEVTNTAYATTFDTNNAASGLTMSGTTISADGTDLNIPITLTPKGTEAVTLDGLDYPMADGAAGTCMITNGSAVLSLGVLTVPGGGTGAATFTDGGIILGSGAGAFTVTAQPTNGQVLIGSAGADPVLATITAGANITVTNAAGTITIASSAGGIAWSEITNAAKQGVVNEGYIINRGGGVTVTLPDVAAVGSVIRICGMTGIWVVAQNALETILIGDGATTVGVGGSLTATKAGDCIEMLCVVSGATWRVISMVGNITVV